MRRVTITVPDHVLEAVQRRVAAGDASSVSSFFAAAADEKTSSGGLAALLDDLDREFGPVDEESKRAVDEVVARIDAGEIGPFDLRSRAPKR